MSYRSPEELVTDHALIRWLERVHGMPMEWFREELAEKVREAIEVGATGLTHEGFAYCFFDGKLITVKPKEKPGCTPAVVAGRPKVQKSLRYGGEDD